jgi:adenylate cyclase
MAEERTQRRLAAVFAADVAGYSRLMGADEEGTLARLKVLRRDLLDPKIEEHRGRIVKTTGDGLLAEFASVVDALRCAVDVQRGMAERNGQVEPEKRIEFRVGINVGDIVFDRGDIYGDGVNVAARLEGLAEPGGICVSGRVQEDARGKLDLAFEDLGEQRLKNIAWPVRVYRVQFGDQAATPGANSPILDKPSIAVLPFQNMSGDPGQQYFSDGITEDIITELSRFRQLHVLARNTSFRYRGQDIDVIRAGRELGVQYLVEGSIRRLGDQLRITAQLVETASAHHVWAERFDRSQDELFAVQDQVVRTIVGTLVGRVRAADLEHSMRKPPASLAAYEYVLRGDALPFDDKSENEAEERRLFERAVELDPGYAKAYALLANSFCREWWRDMSGSDSALDQAFALAKKAVALDQNDDTCQAALGWVHVLRGSYELAEHQYFKALELNRNSPMLLANLGGLYACLGKPIEAMNYLKEAKLLDAFFDPTWYWPLVGIAHFGARRYDEAIAALCRTPSLRYWAPAYLAASYALTERIDRARFCAAEVLRLLPSFSLVRFAAKQSYKLLADREHLIDGLRKAGLPE